MREEPLLHNPVVDLDVLKPASMRITLRNAGITKIGHLMNEQMNGFSCMG